MKSKANVFLTVFSLLSIATACVTVNVNFPEATVQKATDDFVDELYRTKKGGSTSATAGEHFQTVVSRLINMLIATASAEAPEFSTLTPETKPYLDRMATRLDKIDAFKAKGIIAESPDGTLEVRNAGAAKTEDERKAVKQVTEAENEDREELYKTISKNNRYPETKLRENFYQSFVRKFKERQSKR